MVEVFWNMIPKQERWSSNFKFQLQANSYFRVMHIDLLFKYKMAKLVTFIPEVATIDKMAAICLHSHWEMLRNILKNGINDIIWCLIADQSNYPNNLKRPRWAKLDLRTAFSAFGFRCLTHFLWWSLVVVFCCNFVDLRILYSHSVVGLTKARMRSYLILM